jgi:predicted TPR repeat methyltransferase
LLLLFGAWSVTKGRQIASAMARLKANVEINDAIANCQLALSLDSKNAKAFFRMAQAHQKNGDFDSAKEKLQQLLNIDPDNAEAAAEVKV